MPSLALAQSLSLAPSPNRAGAAVSDNLDPSFAGFGIEPSNLFSFTGWNEPNEFSIQLLQNLADYAGAPPHIRVGGNTQDYMVYDPEYEDFGWKKNANSTAQGVIAADSMIIGPGYLRALDRFPKDTFITYGLNLAYEGSDYLDRMTTHASGVVKELKNTRLYSFEIGNEPDLYLQNGMRTAPWDGKVYTDEFMERADTVYQKVLKPNGMAPMFFEPPATASTIGTTFEIAMLNKNGILDQMNGEYYVGWWNQHDYFYCTLSHPLRVFHMLTHRSHWCNPYPHHSRRPHGHGPDKHPVRVLGEAGQDRARHRRTLRSARNELRRTYRYAPG